MLINMGNWFHADFIGESLSRRHEIILVKTNIPNLIICEWNQIWLLFNIYKLSCNLHARFRMFSQMKSFISVINSITLCRKWGMNLNLLIKKETASVVSPVTDYYTGPSNSTCRSKLQNRIKLIISNLKIYFTPVKY